MKNQKRLTCTYLYADGHAVQLFEKNDPDAGNIEFVEITEKFTEAHLSFEGRILFDRYNDGLVWLAKNALRIEAREASLERGSDNTKKLGIAVGHCEFKMKFGDVWFTSMDRVISCPYTYQPKNTETFDPTLTHWCAHHVAKIHRVKAPASAERAVA